MAVGQVGSILYNTTTRGENALRDASGAARGGVSAAQQGLANVQAAGSQIDTMLGDAAKLAGQSTRIVNGLDADIDALRGLAPQITGLTDDMSASADAISELRRQIAAQGGNVAAFVPRVTALGDQLLGRVGATDALAGDVQGVASRLSPFADSLGALADEALAHGHDMVGRGNTVLDRGQGLLDLDPASGALAAELMKKYAEVNPETYAARAAADVQNASDIARAQSQRELARRGVSLSSGVSAALQRQLATALAAAKAGAMTRGREEGRKEQLGMLNNIFDRANELLQTGTTMQKTGVDEELGSATARKSAADVVDSIGQLLANAGTIFGIGNSAVKGAGELYGTAGGLEASVADIYGKSVEAEKAAVDARDKALSGIKTQAGIYDTAAGRQLDQAKALNDAAGVHQTNAQVKNQYLSNLNNANRAVVDSYGALVSAFNAAANYYGGLGQQMIAADAQMQAAQIRASREGGGGGGGGSSGGGREEKTGAWVNLFPGSGHANHEWIWDPNASAEPIDA